LEIDAASNTGVDNIRNVIEEVQYRPARDRNKIYIIDEVHMLSTAAFNALLKTLEEPPPHVTFIMATTEYHKIPSTISSRCQQYAFKLIRYPLILERLRTIAASENIRIASASLEQITFSSGGSMRDAMSALDQVIAFSGNDVRDEDVHLLLGLIEPAMLGDTVRAIAANETESILRIVADLAEGGQDLENFCRRLSGHFRNLMVIKAGVADSSVLGVPESLIPDLKAQSGLFSREDLLRLFDALLRIESELKYATQVRFQLEMGLLELAHISRLRPLEELIAELQSPRRQDSSANPTEKPLQRTLSTGQTGSESRTFNQSKSEPGRRDVSSGTSPLEKKPAENSPLATAPASPALGTAPDPSPIVEGDSRELLSKIAVAVKKESLESFLLSLEGARLEGDLVILAPAKLNQFYRQKVEENLALITEAACSVLGRRVTVRLGDPPAPKIHAAADTTDAEGPPQLDAHDVARREPVVQSFLDVFPGPVKVERMDK